MNWHLKRRFAAVALGGALALTLAWSCAALSPIYAQSELERQIEEERLRYGKHEHPIEMEVRGVPLAFRDHECARLVKKALRRNEALPIDDEECEELMAEALEIQRTVPPPVLTPTGPPAQRFGRSEGYTRALEDEEAAPEPAPPEAAPPPAGQPPRMSFGKSAPK